MFANRLKCTSVSYSIHAATRREKTLYTTWWSKRQWDAQMRSPIRQWILSHCRFRLIGYVREVSNKTSKHRIGMLLSLTSWSRQCAHNCWHLHININCTGSLVRWQRQWYRYNSPAVIYHYKVAAFPSALIIATALRHWRQQHVHELKAGNDAAR